MPTNRRFRRGEREAEGSSGGSLPRQSGRAPNADRSRGGGPLSEVDANDPAGIDRTSATAEYETLPPRRPAKNNREEHDGSEDDGSFPPRRVLHPSEKGKWTRRFYATLLVLFVGLILSIIGWYGWHGKLLPFK